MIIKTLANDGRTCRVTFRLTAAAESAAVVGDFNLWNPQVHPLARREDGTLGVTVELEPGDYRFRYLVDGAQWLNDEGADGWVANDFGTADSVVAIVPQETIAADQPVAEPSSPAAAKKRVARPRSAAKKAAEKTAKPAAKASAKPTAPRAPKTKK